jgi:hypothetical protein
LVRFLFPGGSCRINSGYRDSTMSSDDPSDEPMDDVVPSTRSRRRAHREHRRRHQRRIVGAIVASLVAVGAGLVLTDTVRLPRGSGPRVAEGAERGGATSSAGSGLAAPRPLTPDTPLKLWIGGDSLAGSLGPSLGLLTGNTGVVQPQFDSRVSSGLTTPSFFDWPQHATQEMTRLDPEAVVFIIGTNDGPTVQKKPLDASGAPEWRAHYAALVDEMMKILVGARGRTVYWVGAPIMEDNNRSDEVRQLNEVGQEVAARHPEVTYVDSYELFAGRDGKYAASLPSDSGRVVRMRADDGVHLTPEGGDRLAGAVFMPLDARWHITAQAVRGNPKPVLETEGSSQVPGTGRHVSAVTPTTSGRSATTSSSAPPSTSTSIAPTTTSGPPASSTSSTPSTTG